MIIRSTILALASALVFTTSASAELLRVEIKTLGMDWETCAHAVRVAMRKVDGIQTVNVSLKEGLTVLELRPDNKVTLAQLRQVIKNNGFVSRDAVITARGAVSGNTFAVTGTGEQLAFIQKPSPEAGERWQFTSPVK